MKNLNVRLDEICTPRLAASNRPDASRQDRRPLTAEILILLREALSAALVKEKS